MAESKIKGRDDLVRRAHVVANVDREGYLAYIAKRDADAQKDKTISDLQTQLNELKAMVQKLAGGK